MENSQVLGVLDGNATSPLRPPKKQRQRAARAGAASPAKKKIARAGTRRSARQNPTSFNALPDELVLLVLQRVPSHDLLHAVPAVCRRWREICAAKLSVRLSFSQHELRHIRTTSFIDPRGVDLPDIFAQKHPLRNDGLCQVLPKYHKASALSFAGCRKLNNWAELAHSVLRLASAGKPAPPRPPELAVGVRVRVAGHTCNATVRYRGRLSMSSAARTVGVEFDKPIDAGTDGTFPRSHNGGGGGGEEERLFQCPAGHGRLLMESRVTPIAPPVPCPQLRWLDLSNCVGVDDETIATLAEGCPNLRHCNLADQDGLDWLSMVSVEGLQCLTSRCSELRSLDISYSRDLLTDRALDVIATGCPRLDTLKLRCRPPMVWLNIYGDDGLAHIAAHLARLEHLELTGNLNLSDAGIATLLAGCTQLVELDLSHCCGLTGAAVHSVTAGMARARRLKLAGLVLDDTSLEELAVGCPSLVALDISHVVGDPEAIVDGLAHVAARCCKLESLKATRLAGMSDHLILLFREQCPELRTLDLRGCIRLSKVGTGWAPVGLKLLQSLDLSMCTGLTNAGLVKIATGCPSIRSLSIEGCKKISSVGLEAVSASCSKSMKSLDLSGCVKLSDQLIGNSVSKLVQLEHLRVARCKITDTGLSLVATACRALRSLDLSDTTKISDAGMVAVSKGCPQLICLDLHNCVNVTNRGVLAIGKGCPSLQFIGLGEEQAYTAFPSTAILALTAMLPLCTITYEQAEQYECMCCEDQGCGCCEGGCSIS